MMRRFLRVSAVSLAVLSTLPGCDAGSSSNGDDSAGSMPVALKGCAPGDGVNVVTAPGGYYTNLATVCRADGTAHLFHGLDRPSLEWDPAGEWHDSEGIPRSDFAAMAAWHANVVRIALNQDFWLAGAALYDPAYVDTVDRAVKDAEASGLDVILDLHWSDRGDLTASVAGHGQGKAGHADQQQMADVNSKQFWTEVASKYQNDGHVLFELYNEPHDISWDVWLHGGMVGTYLAVGMQDLYDAVRATGAENVVIAGGTNWAFNLSGAESHKIVGHNVMYATHPYFPQDPATQWDGMFGYLAKRDIAPVIVTEFGDHKDNCTGAWNTNLTQYADQQHISWTAWAWWPGDCSFPSLIADWDYTPTVQGEAVKAALANYPYEPAGVPSGSGGGGAGSGGAGNGGSVGNEAGSAGALGSAAGTAGSAEGGTPSL
ncbi:MAG: glycoside hydrolase family 5 protein [Pseudomonadota bacterium]